MIRKGARNLITDVPGLRVGNGQDWALRSGVTVLIADEPAATVVDVRGGAPGTRDTEALDPVSLVEGVDALVLAGGSAFGLDAASGVQAHLKAMSRGFEIAPGLPRVPIVSASILFDLANGGDKEWGEEPPYRLLGRQAAEQAGLDFALGNTGAGLGAVVGRYKGGLGSASVTAYGFTLGALVAVNAVGSPVMPGCDAFWAWPFEMEGEFGGRRPGSNRGADFGLPPDMKGLVQPGANTTIAIIATDVALTRIELKRLAIMATDGFARALRPVHTPFDGDLVYALSTAKRPLTGSRPHAVMALGSLAADTLARAIARGIYEAKSLGSFLSYREIFSV